MKKTIGELILELTSRGWEIQIKRVRNEDSFFHLFFARITIDNEEKGASFIFQSQPSYDEQLLIFLNHVLNLYYEIIHGNMDDFEELNESPMD